MAENEQQMALKQTAAFKVIPLSLESKCILKWKQMRKWLSEDFYFPWASGVNMHYLL